MTRIDLAKAYLTENERLQKRVEELEAELATLRRKVFGIAQKAESEARALEEKARR